MAHPLDVSNIPCTKSPSVLLSSHTHRHTHAQTGLRSGVCMRWQSALSVRSSAPTGPPDGHGVSITPFAHMKTPYILQPPSTPPAPYNKVRNYNLSERCLVQKSSLALIWQWLQRRDFWHNFTCLQDARGKEMQSEEVKTPTTLIGWKKT